jgi:hypothetical protein
MLLLPRHYSMTFSSALESRVLFQSPGLRNSTRPSMRARRVCSAPHYWHTPTLPRHLHSSRTPPLSPWVPCCSNLSTTLGSSSHSSPGSGTQPSRNTAHTIANCWLSEAVKHFRPLTRGRYKITNTQLSEGNFKEKEKLVTGPRWAPDTGSDWPTDCRS